MCFDLQHDCCVAAVWIQNVQSSSTTVLCRKLAADEMRVRWLQDASVMLGWAGHTRRIRLSHGKSMFPISELSSVQQALS